MAGKIQIISKELIKPSYPTLDEIKEHKFSFLDQIQGPVYVPLIFFYQNHEDSSSSSCNSSSSTSIDNIDHIAKKSQLLKQSLSEVLAIFYPLAGRIIGNLLVDCNDLGALFVEARVHSPLTKLAIPIQELNQYLPAEPWTIPDGHCVGNNTPLLAIQFNSFECGGIAIGVCISHKIADAMSFLTFISSWAAKTRGKDDEIVSPDFHLANQIFPALDQELPIPHMGKRANTPKLVTKRFVFDKEMVAALKEEASSGALKIDPAPTRMEAVSAFLWKHFIVTYSSKSDAETMFIAHHAVNLRPRMGLSSDTFAFGNFAVLANASLMSSEDQEYHNLVQHLRTAIKKINGHEYVNTTIRSELSHLHNSSEGLQLRSKQKVSDRCFCFFSDWRRFSMYDVDYGWSKPISVCNVLPLVQNFVILMNTRCGEGMEAWVCMLEDEMALLPNELLSLATDDIIICPSNHEPI